MSSKYRRAALSLICVAPLALAPSVGAQPPEAPVVVPAPLRRAPLVPAPIVEVAAKTIALHNVPPDMIAWQIDPTRQREPLMLANSRRMMRDYGFTVAEKLDLRPVFENNLQDGEALIADNEHKRLLLVGFTEESAREIALLVAFLDRPLRQVEIEMQLVEVDDYAMKRLGIKLFDAGDLNIAMADPRGKRGLLQEMIEAEEVRVVASPPRITLINNLAGVVDVTPSTLADEKEKGDILNVQRSDELQLQMRLYGAVTPTINNDDTVTMILRFAKTRWINRPQSPAKDAASAPDAPWERGDESSAIRYDTVSDLTSVINVRDGDTLILSGLSADLMNNPASNAAPTAAKTLLILVTTRIIRRIDEPDAKAVPAKP